MNALAKSQFAWLLKREYWEARRGFLRAQIVVACVLVALTLLGIVALEVAAVHAGNSFNVNIGGGSIGDILRTALSRNSDGMAQGLDGLLFAFAGFASIALSFVMFFYLLGALYDDRRDRSILFWKSLPVSDTATVLSKVVAAVVIAPLIAVVTVLAGFLVELVVLSLWVLVHGANPFTSIWAHITPFASWLQLLATLPINALWALPTVGWLLFWSAAVRSKPFLWAIAVPVMACLLNWWVALLQLPHIPTGFFLENLVARPLFSVVPAGWASLNPDALSKLVDAGAIDRHLGTYRMMYHTLLTPQLWIGAIAGIALIAAAIWFRRWRDDA